MQSAKQLHLVDQLKTTRIHRESRKKYICDICGLTLYSHSGIRRHMDHKHLGRRTSSGTQLKTEICGICGVYTTKRNYKGHVDSHSTAREFKCDICGTAVKSIFTLRKHFRRVHMEMKSSETSLSADEYKMKNFNFVCETF